MSTDNVLSRTTSSFSTANARLKRKRDELDNHHDEEHPITLKPLNKSILPARTLLPICLLSRAQLPLSWLDPSPGGIPILTGQVHMLERRDDEAALLLVARDLLSQRLNAIERAGTKKYALCQLSMAVEQRVLERRAIVRYSTLKSEEDTGPIAAICAKRQHIMTPTAEAPKIKIEHSEPPEAKTTLCEAPEAPFVQKQTDQPIDVLIEAVSITSAPSPIIEGQPRHQSDLEMAPVVTNNVQEQSSQDMLAEVSKQYLEALYLSRTSVAYFVKGPLARARANFSADTGTDLRSSALLEFLREVIMSTSVTDKRLKETIPALVRELVERPQQHEDGASKPKRQPKWKPRRDRSGFLSNEKQIIELWWQEYDRPNDTNEVLQTLQDHVNHRTQHLRSREAYLQIIVIMEAMALEAARASSSTEGIQSPQPPRNETPVPMALDKKRSKRPLDLQNQLELLLDRLTIWHSIDFSSPINDKVDADSTGNSTANDELRDFCTEAVIPFYKSRIPKIASFVNKKLGGTSAPTPVKRSSSARKPGEPAQRRRPEKKPRNPLHRVSTDSQVHASRTPPALSRSATDSQIADGVRIKRESSVSSSVRSIPLARSDSQRQRTNTLASLTRREIDLTAVSAASENKLRKKAEQEARVREAIAAIRKPDRALALKDNAASIDSKFARDLLTRKPSYNAGGAQDPAIHIAATPNTARHVTVPSSIGELTSRYHMPSSKAESLAPPTMIVVPQTGHRERAYNVVAQTPSGRGNIAADETPSGLIESPILQKTSRIECTPLQPRTLFSLAETPLPTTGRREAPIKRTSSLFATRPERTMSEVDGNAGTAIQTSSNSLYDQLGWDDEEYEELA